MPWYRVFTFPPFNSSHVLIDMDGKGPDSTTNVLFMAGAGEQINSILGGTGGKLFHVIYIRDITVD